MSNLSEALIIEQMIILFHRLVIVDPNKTIVPVSEFFGEKCQWQPEVVDELLEHGAHAEVAGIGCEGNW